MSQKFICLGKFTSTHGIHGEIRIRSSFPFKEKAYRIGSSLWIKGSKYTITHYRRHKEYDMIQLEGITNINQILPLKGEKVYKEESELNLSEEEVLDEELITFQVLTNLGQKGTIKEIFSSGFDHKILRIEVAGKEYLIPYEDVFIKKINKTKQEVEIEWIAW